MVTTRPVILTWLYPVYLLCVLDMLFKINIWFMLFASQEVCIGKNYNRGLDYSSRPQAKGCTQDWSTQFLPIQTDQGQQITCLILNLIKAVQFESGVRVCLTKSDYCTVSLTLSWMFTLYVVYGVTKGLSWNLDAKVGNFRAVYTWGLDANIQTAGVHD